MLGWLDMDLECILYYNVHSLLVIKNGSLAGADTRFQVMLYSKAHNAGL